MEEGSRSGSRRIVVLSFLAQDDRLNAYLYTVRRWNEAQADKYTDFLDDVMQDLAEDPAVAAHVPNLVGVRSYVARWKNTRQGHRIFFREIEEGIYVLRILHTAMSWPPELSGDL